MIHYSLASSSWDDKEIAAIQKVIDSNRYTMGEHVERFEKDFAEKFGSKYAVMLNSGSSANLIAIAALCYKKDRPLKAGDEVIVPSLSWSTTYYPLHQYGLKAVFVDIDLKSLNLDITRLEAAMSEKTRAIFVPNILGNPAELGILKAFCDKHQIYLIEDNCESMGATLEGRDAGTFGICGTFSTFFSHHIATMEGGVVVTDDEEIYHLMLCLRSHGWTRHLPEQNRLCVKSDNPFYESFRFILPGYNVRPCEMSGAIGVEQLKKLNGFIDARRRNADHFTKIYGHDDRFLLQQENGKSSWFGFSLILQDPDIDRDTLVKKLMAAGIEIRPVVSGNFLRNDVIKHLNHRISGDIINADIVHERGFFVGNHQFDITDKIDYFKTVTERALCESVTPA